MYNRDNQGGALTRRQQEGLGRTRGSDWFWRADPWQEMQEMQRRMDQLFSRAFGGAWPSYSASGGQIANQGEYGGIAEPDVDISENETEYTIRAALPGISPDDINIQATEDSIRLTAHSRSSWDSGQNQGANQADNTQAGDGNSRQSENQLQTQQNQQATQHRQGNFSRVSRFEFAYSIPEEIKPDEVRANFRNGVLELRLPKARPNAGRNRAVTIPISAGEQSAQIGGITTTNAGSQPSSAGGAEHQTGSRTGDGTSTRSEGGQTEKSSSSGSGAAAKSK